MTESCARDLTNRIRAAVNDFSEMLWRAHQGKARRALGYGSWKEYCTAEFKMMSERRSFQLLDFVEIKRSIPQLNHGTVSERSLRPLKSVEPGKRAEVYQAAVEIAGGEQPTAKQVKQAVVDVLPPKPREPKYRPAIASEIVDSVSRLGTILDEDTQRLAAFQKLLSWVVERIDDDDPNWLLKAEWMRTHHDDKVEFLKWDRVAKLISKSTP